MDYRFVFPQPNGDMPTVCVVQADTVRDAIIVAIRKVGFDIVNSTMFEGGGWKLIGKLTAKWPGPVICIDDRPVMQTSAGSAFLSVLPDAQDQKRIDIPIRYR